MDLENFPTSECGKRLLNRVNSDFYQNSYVGKWIYQVLGLEMDRVMKIVDDLPNQMFVDTATWGLVYWEMAYGLDVRNEMSYEWRRRRIHELRDRLVPPSPKYMEDVLNNITGRDVSVKDYYDDHSIPIWEFTVDIGDGHKTLDISKVRQKLNEIKQSHVVYTLYSSVQTTIKVGVSHSTYIVIHTPAGTVPNESTGLGLQSGTLKYDVNSREYTAERKKAGEVNAGTVPGQSTGMSYNPGNVIANVASSEYEAHSPMPGETTTGTYPDESVSLSYKDPGNGMSVETSVNSYSVVSKVCGSQSTL